MFNGKFLKHFKTMIRKELKSAEIEEYKDVKNDSYGKWT